MWYLKKYLREGWFPVTVLTFILLSSFMCTSCVGETWCYECAFGPSPPPSNPSCRPGDFDVNKIQSIKCEHGCSMYILYEFEPNALVTQNQNVSKKPNISAIATLADDKKNTEAITFVVRRCAQKRLPRSGCVVKEFDNMHEKDCYCSTNYCNGLVNAGASVKREALTLGSTFLLSLIMTKVLGGSWQLCTNVHYSKTLLNNS